MEKKLLSPTSPAKPHRRDREEKPTPPSTPGKHHRGDVVDLEKPTPPPTPGKPQPDPFEGSEEKPMPRSPPGRSMPLLEATPFTPMPDEAEAWIKIYESRPLKTTEEFKAWQELLSRCSSNPTDITSHERLINLLFVRKADA